MSRDTILKTVYQLRKNISIKEAEEILEMLQSDFEEKLITKVYPFETFKPSREEIKNYYYQNPRKPFCETYINPKLKLLLTKFSKQVDSKKINHNLL